MPRRPAFLLLALIAIAVFPVAGCNPGSVTSTSPPAPDGGPPPPPPEEPAAEAHENPQDVPFLAAVAAAHAPPQAAPSASEMAEALARDEHAEVRAALDAAGFSSEEQAALVSLAAAYGSAQPHDPAHARAVSASEQWNEATAELRAALDRTEEVSGGSVDRTQLVRGIFPRLEELPESVR